MKADDATKFIAVTLGLGLGLALILTASFRARISTNWDDNRCDPYVVPFSGFFKPDTDPRTATEFARDNWSFCQKEYIQNAIRTAAQGVQDLADAESDVGGLVEEMVGVFADVFFDIWTFFHEVYSTFMDRMKVAAKIFQNMMTNFHSIVDRLQAMIFSIVMALMSTVILSVNTIRFILMVAIIVVGILIAMAIILFWIFPPIGGFIADMVAVIGITAITVMTVLGAEVACFVRDTPVLCKGRTVKPIQDICIGDTLLDGSRVTAVHRFSVTNAAIYDLYGVRVTGDHLVMHPENFHLMIPVHDHPDAMRVPSSFLQIWSNTDLWCLTTTSRRIPIQAKHGKDIVFADWEEIADNDTDSLCKWYDTVWTALNGDSIPLTHATSAVLETTAAISPDCMVALTATREMRAGDLKIGDRVAGGGRIIGIVEIAEDEIDHGVELPSDKYGPQCVSCSVWLANQQGVWAPPEGFRRANTTRQWLHFYTDKGVLELAGGWKIRDASDVGLENLSPIVADIVLGGENRCHR
jgi:hypothetical protein